MERSLANNDSLCLRLEVLNNIRLADYSKE